MVATTKNKGKHKQMATSESTKNHSTQTDTRTNYYEVFQSPNNLNTTKGYDMLKHEDSIRISSVNLCGITTRTFEQALLQAQRMHIDIQCFVENNINVSNFYTRRNLYKTLKKTDSFAKAVWANSPLPSDTSFQPGGTSIVVFGTLASRVKTTGQDPLGRWSYVILEGKDGKEIIVISVYQSCKVFKFFGVLIDDIICSLL